MSCLFYLFKELYLHLSNILATNFLVNFVVQAVVVMKVLNKRNLCTSGMFQEEENV
ncbi:MAG: hypothetical protein PWR01_2407 [Clostridiales bacterium]|jgi:hypothetical protein|nr:hypothetical protein [Clostridiales bacterium]MDN5281334.1 hypothetical protein [Candidatus Ozemobacter sp.]